MEFESTIGGHFTNTTENQCIWNGDSCARARNNCPFFCAILLCIGSRTSLSFVPRERERHHSGKSNRSRQIVEISNRQTVGRTRRPRPLIDLTDRIRPILAILLDVIAWKRGCRFFWIPLSTTPRGASPTRIWRSISANVDRCNAAWPT